MTGLIGSSKQAAPVGISPQILRSSLTCHAVALLEGGTFRCQRFSISAFQFFSKGCLDVTPFLFRRLSACCRF